MTNDVMTGIVMAVVTWFIIIPLVREVWRGARKDAELQTLRRLEQQARDEQDRERLKEKFHV